MFNFLRQTAKIDGEIGYFGLQSWWLNDLSSSERARIQDRFRPSGTGPSDLTKGKISYSTQTVIGFLGSLSGWFSKPDDFPIAVKILKKAEILINQSTAILDVHFLYQNEIQIYYRNRNSPNCLEKAIEACNKQIAIARQTAVAFRKDFPQILPGHKGYEQLAIILEKEKNFDEAIRLCEQAASQGWSGGWQNRIIRCKKRMVTQSESSAVASPRQASGFGGALK